MSNQLNYNHLWYFHVVASEGSLRAASDRLHVTQPTISEQLRALESTLGDDLFDRSGGRLRLNEAGRALFRDTEAMFAIGDRIAQRHLDSALPDERELLRVGVSSSLSASFSASYLLPLLADAGVRVRVTQGAHDRVLRSLVGWEIDLMLASEIPQEVESKGLKSELLETGSLVAIAGVDRGATIAEFPAGLAGHPSYTYLPASQRRFELDHWLMAQGLSLQVFGETNDLPLMIAAAAFGHCVAFVPRAALGGADRRGEVMVLGALDSPEAEAYALYHSKESPERVTSAVGRLRGG